MQKVVAILEQHVQWIAIGLGAIFVLFMTWSYVLTPPAQVQIGSENLTAGEVDEYTVEHVAKDLESKINANEKITMAVPSYVGKFKDAMAWKDAAALNLAGGWNSQTLDVSMPGAPTPPGQPPSPSAPQIAGQPPVDAEKVAELPKLPKATPAESKFGRSVVIVPPAAGQPVAQPVAQPIPGQTQGVDRDWVTQMFKINMAGLDSEFKRTKIPQTFTKTLFLQIEMEREELDGDGKPVAGSSKILPPVAQWRASVAPPAFPADEGPRELQAQYLQWASANGSDVLQPQYYVIEKGDLWAKPGQQINALAVFDPAAWVGPKGTLTDEQWQQVLKARQEQTRLRNEQNKANRPVRQPRAPTGAPPGAAGEGTLYAPAPPRQPPPRAPQAPPAYRPGYGGGIAAPPPGRFGNGRRNRRRFVRRRRLRRLHAGRRQSSAAGRRLSRRRIHSGGVERQNHRSVGA